MTTFIDFLNDDFTIEWAAWSANQESSSTMPGKAHPPIDTVFPSIDTALPSTDMTFASVDAAIASIDTAFASVDEACPYDPLFDFNVIEPPEYQNVDFTPMDPLAFPVAQSVEATQTVAFETAQIATPEPAFQGLQTPPLTASPPSHANPGHVTITPTAFIHVPIYAPFSNCFADRAEAAAHRAKTRIGPLIPDAGFDLVKQNRPYWLERLYAAAVSTSKVQDGARSAGWKRFVDPPRANSEPFYNQRDIESQIWKLFDAVCKLYTTGLNLPVYLNVDDAKFPQPETVQERLELLCDVLEKWKAAGVDLMDGGWKLKKLVQNPAHCEHVKAGNRKSNLDKAVTIKAGQVARKRKLDEQ